MPLEPHGRATETQLTLLAALGYQKRINTLVKAEDRYEKRPEELTAVECAELYVAINRMEDGE